jgi:hypothetical protein
MEPLPPRAAPPRAPCLPVTLNHSVYLMKKMVSMAVGALGILVLWWVLWGYGALELNNLYNPGVVHGGVPLYTGPRSPVSPLYPGLPWNLILIRW